MVMNPFITLPDFHSCTAFSHNSLFSPLTIAHPHRCLLIVGFPPFATAMRDQDSPVVPIGGIETILVIKVSAESANQFGELVADPVTNELLHYTEKPETFVSDRINCGVCIFTPDIFNAIQGVSTQQKDRGTITS
ncbi:unnamed protein product [Camellia sinensis]